MTGSQCGQGPDHCGKRSGVCRRSIPCHRQGVHQIVIALDRLSGHAAFESLDVQTNLFRQAGASVALTLQDSTHLGLTSPQIGRNLSLRDASLSANVARTRGAGFKVRTLHA